MKPYGREKKVRLKGLSKRDVAPPGWKNWWEDTIPNLTRTALKRLWKKSVEDDLK